MEDGDPAYVEGCTDVTRDGDLVAGIGLGAGLLALACSPRTGTERGGRRPWARGGSTGSLLVV